MQLTKFKLISNLLIKVMSVIIILFGFASCSKNNTSNKEITGKKRIPINASERAQKSVDESGGIFSGLGGKKKKYFRLFNFKRNVESSYQLF